MPQPPNRTKPADYHFHVYDYTSAQPWVLSKGEPQRNNLQFYSMVQDLQGLLVYGRAQGVPNIALNDVGVGILGADDWVLRKIKALSFGGPKGNFSKTPSALITGGIHAREWIAPEMAYLLAEYLIRNYSNADPDTLTPYQRNIRQLVDNRRIHIIPLLNPNGNNYTVFSQDQGARMWRKNRRQLPETQDKWIAALNHSPFEGVTKGALGFVNYKIPGYVVGPGLLVPPGQATFKTFSFNPLRKDKSGSVPRIGADLNRNFPTTAWGYYTTSTNYDPKESSDDYFGPSAASEAETGAVVVFVRNIQRPGVSIDYHSYGQAILYPSEAWNNDRVTTEYQILGTMMQEITGYRLGPPKPTMGYDGVGSLMDFASSFPAMSSFTIEMDPAPGAGEQGFLLPENQIQMVFEKNIRAALALIAAAGESWKAGVPYWAWNVIGRGNKLPE
jgi:hypothetical protein